MLLFLLSFCCWASDRGQAAVAQPLPTYELIPGTFTWHEAKLDAEKRGGHLVTITSQSEWNVIVTLLGGSLREQLLWLGANNDNPEKLWTWVTGEKWEYTRWASPSEPSGVGGKGPENYLLTWGAGNEFWNDGTGLDRRGYILEVDSRTNTYELIEGAFTWQEAKLDAEKRGGHLATITSDEEWKTVMSLFGNNLLGVFLGGADEKQDGVWRWITGEPWTFENWAGGQPDNSSGAQHFLWLHPAYGLKWDDTASALGSESKYLLEVEWQPSPQTNPPQAPLLNAFTLSRLAYGKLQGLRLPVAPPDRTAFAIETSVDLKTWIPLITFPTNSGPFEFIDSTATNQLFRFYRTIKK